MENEKWLKKIKNKYVPSILEDKKEEIIIYIWNCVENILKQNIEYFKIRNKNQLEEDIENTQEWYTKNIIILKIRSLSYIKSLIWLKWYDNILRNFKCYINKKIFQLTWWKWNLYIISEDEFIFYNKEKNENIKYDESNFLLDPIEIIKEIENIIKRFNVDIDWEKIYLDYSIWAKFYDDDYNSDIIKDSYQALDEVNDRKNTKSIIYTKWLDEERNKKNNSKIKRIRKIRKAFENQEENNFDIVLQWIYNEDTKKIEKYETLSRYKTTNENWEEQLISPYFYMEHIEELDYTLKLMNNNVKKLLNFINYNNLTNIDFSLNCYVSDILDLNNFNLLDNLLHKYNILHNNIIIEILEHWDLTNIEKEQQFISNIKKLKEMWFKIAIDDFWSWQSNFIRLLQIEPHFIKIDWSFIKWISHNSNNQKIVNSILLLSKLYNSEIIVEFVANEEDYLYLKSLWIKLFQGYHFHEPQHLEEIVI